MPYTFGLDFVRTVLTKKGTSAAYPGMLEHPPVDTLQVMEPETYLANKVVDPPTIPDLNKLIAPDYDRYDFGGMGAFDIFLLARQYAPKGDAKEYYPHWRGGYYLAAHAKSAPKDQIALLFFSRWDSAAAAKAFALLYSAYTPTRYHLKDAGMLGSGGGDLRFQWDVGPQGQVVIQTSGNDVLVLEGFDADTIERLRAALLPDSQPTGDESANTLHNR